jgi:hypothetical protein
MKDTLNSLDYLAKQLKTHCASRCIYLPEDVQRVFDENANKWLAEFIEIEVTKTKEELCLK